MEKMVLVLLCRGAEIYLGEKKKKIGQGLLNSPGGKMEPEDGGDLRQAAIRETRQECGVIVNADDLVQVALLKINHCSFKKEIEISVFRTDKWTGDFVETEELGLLQPYKTDRIPFEKMMAADKGWLPLVVQGGVSITVNINYGENFKDVFLTKISPGNFK